MPHLKRNKFEKFWPIPRKGTTYVAVASHNQKSSIPLIIVMRDIFKLVKTKKELKKAINEKQIKINGKEIREVNYPVCLFDVVSVLDKNYKASLSEGKRFIFREVSGKEAEEKVIKVIGKKVLGKDKVQINLLDGRNVFVKDKIDVEDSVVYNFKDKKVEKVIKMEKGRTGFVFSGKHAGIKGNIEEIMERGGKKLVKIREEDVKINVWVKNVIVM